MSVSTPSTARTYPLRSLLLLLMCVLAVPTLLLAALAVRSAVASNRTTIERRLVEEARGLRRNAEAELQATIRTLQAMSDATSLANDDLIAFRGEAARYVGAHPAWFSVLLATPDGRQLMSTAIPPGAPLPSDAVNPESLRAAADRREPVIGALRQGWRADGLYAFPVRLPVIRDGQVVYILSAIITPEGLRTALSMDENVAEGLRAIVNADDIIVTRTRDPQRFIGSQVAPDFLRAIQSAEEGMFESTTLDGEQVYSGVSRGSTSGWRGVVAMPRAAVERDFVGAMTLLGIMGGLLLGLGAAGSYFIARWIARDISMVTEAATELSGGKAVVMGAPRVLEVRRLASALDRSAALIRVREQERDQRVSRADAARAEAEAAARAKDEFLAMLGHELRNPLAPVLNALHVARATGGTLADREARIVERQVRHMARLVDDLLDVSRMRRGGVELQLEHADLRGIVNEVVEMTRALVDEQGQTLTIDVPVGLMLLCDAHRLTQVLSNLLTNAAKYTEPGGTITLAARAEGSDIVIVCEDNGIGIRADLLARVFDPFVQGARGIDRRQGGLGLGLAVARSLVEQHGGSISAHSDGDGQGSRFVVRLPMRITASDVIEDGAVPPPVAPRPVRVLVVEDNDDVRDMLTLALTLGGVDVRGEASAAAALAMTETWTPTVAVLDIGLPGMDGFALARAMRARESSRNVHLIALTGYGGGNYVAEAKEAGFDEFFVKPIGVDALLDAVAKLKAR